MTIDDSAALAPADFIDVVVRCRNEMPHAARTLAALARQRGPRARVLFVDCGSTDGSREAAVDAGVTILDVDPAAYVPGRVLNLAMRHTRSAIVAFVNADAVPCHDDALARLLAPLLGAGPPGPLLGAGGEGRIAASYGRQLPRVDACATTRLDHQHAFGDEPPRLREGRFFSMAASAIRRDVWERLPFDEALRFSEDVDWTRRIGALGFELRYAPDARFEHSHDYDAGGQRRRRRGEGRADAAIARLGAPSLVRDLLRPLGGALLRDARGGALSPRGVALRVAQAVGYFEGRREAMARS